MPLAVWLANKRRWAEGVLQVTNILQTIPSLALLGLLIPFVGIGSPPVLIALTLYALLPIFQNTYLGLSQIDPAIKEAHTAFGLSRWQALWRIELPMALPAMISGIRTASVLIIGTATLAALIGAGGLGNLILLGIDRNNMAMTFTGALLSRPARRTGQRRHRSTTKVQTQTVDYCRPAYRTRHNQLLTRFSEYGTCPRYGLPKQNHHRRQARQRTRHPHQYVQTVD